MENVLMEIYITVNPNRTVSLSEFSFFQAFAFANQILPGSGTFNLSVGPLSLSKVLSFWRAKPCSPVTFSIQILFFKNSDCHKFSFFNDGSLKLDQFGILDALFPFLVFFKL